MKHAIEFTHHNHPFLHVGSRKKSTHSFFIVVEKGAVLVRLGKNEHLVSAGTGFWLPFDCLHALTALPGTNYYQVDFSIRLTTAVCSHAGFFKVTPLIAALLDELSQTASDQHQWDGPEGRILKVLADKAAQLKVSTKTLSPALAERHHSALTLILNGSKITENSDIKAIESVFNQSVKELESCMVMREAIRLQRSGRKLAQIATELSVPETLLNTLALPILGKPL
ncbi:AraC family ligand binding domain-containing protein [Photobacterium damselae]|uniref:AraC family ligand binding domain-containing protein n=1 Tax=Photobacterium damselae TaxID=38293 RepID=UPI00084AEA1F|nr:AraC family ligand binding domain-containing protein [Photobacterium damselae]OEC82262.1 hypothetical protein A9D46_15650 [Photobacterium damselae subsp. damselae]